MSCLGSARAAHLQLLGSGSNSSSCKPFSMHRPRYAHHSSISTRRAVIMRSWQQVIDQASGKPYYWNTATNETAWELPPSTSSSSTTAAAIANTPSQQPQQQQQQQQQQQEQEPQTESVSFDALYNILQGAYVADGSGMQFWEVARAHRQFGVFDAPFFEYLESKQKQLGGVDEDAKDMAFKVMCRLSNPLLRQPAPFEF